MRRSTATTLGTIQLDVETSGEVGAKDNFFGGIADNQPDAPYNYSLSLRDSRKGAVMTAPSFEARFAMQRLAEKECRISSDLYDLPRLSDGRHDLSRVEEKYMECAERLSQERDDEKFRLAQSILVRSLCMVRPCN